MANKGTDPNGGEHGAPVDGAVVLDVRGLNCPLPVLKARKALTGMAPGAELVVQTTDPLAAIDIPAFCNEAGHELVASNAVDDHVDYRIRKG